MQQKVQQQHQEDGQKAGVVTGRAHLEYNWNQLDTMWKEAFKEPLLKAVQGLLRP